METPAAVMEGPAAPATLAEAAAALEAGAPPVQAAVATNIAETQAEYVAEAWRRGEAGFETEHELFEAQTDLAMVRDAMEASDEAIAQAEQEADYAE